MAEVVLSKLVKTFGDVRAVDNVNLTITEGELITLLGPSGCGKTTTLRVIAGLEKQDQGNISIDGRSVNDIPPWERDCGFVFQNYALFPHMTVFDNIAYGLEIRKWNREDIKKRVAEVTAFLAIEPLLDRYPRQLSGGQQQRVAVARALAMKPSVLLMDEPLTGLDAKLRERVRFELKEVQRQTGITMIYVTHDQEEAFALADRVVIMHRGNIEQVGTPDEIYYHPTTRFVAEFVGSNNSLSGEVKGMTDDKYMTVQSGDLKLTAVRNQPYRVGDKVAIVIRTSDLNLQPEQKAGHMNNIPARIIGKTFTGTVMRVAIEANGTSLIASIPAEETTKPLPGEERVWLTIPPERIRIFKADD